MNTKRTETQPWVAALPSPPIKLLTAQEWMFVRWPLTNNQITISVVQQPREGTNGTRNKFVLLMSSEHVNAETISTMQSIWIPPRCYSYSGCCSIWRRNRRRFLVPDFLSLSLCLSLSYNHQLSFQLKSKKSWCSFSPFLLMTLFTTHFKGINSGNSEFFCHRNRNVSLIE